MVEIRILLPSMKIERAKRARETAEGLGGGGGGGGGGAVSSPQWGLGQCFDLTLISFKLEPYPTML